MQMALSLPVTMKGTALLDWPFCCMRQTPETGPEATVATMLRAVPARYETIHGVQQDTPASFATLQNR